MEYELLVLGAGGAGIGAAREARRRGAQVALISDGPPGGDCTWTGCVPSKTLIEAAKAGAPATAALERVREVVRRVAATEDAAALGEEGIAVIEGRGRFIGKHTIAVGETEVVSERVLLATGSSPAVPPIPGLAEADYLTNENVFELFDAPTSMIVLGGGAIGCELAQAFARLGTAITVVEAAPRLLPREDPEASAVIEAVFEREGIEVRTGVKAMNVKSEPGAGVTLELDDGTSLESERLLVAVGRTPNTTDLGCADVGIECDRRGYVQVDDHLATTVPGVFAIGDVTGLMPFTHAAFEQGRVAAANALGRKGVCYDPSLTPRVAFTEPEVAAFGASESEAASGEARVAQLPMSEVDRAIAAGATDGFVKLIAARKRPTGWIGGGKIVGATIVCERAGEVLAEVALAAHTGMFAGRLAQATHAYPTWSLAVQEAAAQLVMEYKGRTARPARA